ncbi:dynein heavy chain, partial [Caulochytrium protostelioides]
RAYQRLLFSLTFFHAVVIERKKFLSLGWNVAAEFNDSDFETSQSLLEVLLNDYAEIPWDAMRYLIAEATYGGRVTDEWDRRTVKSYVNQYL